MIDKARALGVVADEFGIPLPAAALQFPLGDEIMCSVIPGRETRKLEQIVLGSRHLYQQNFGLL